MAQITHAFNVNYDAETLALVDEMTKMYNHLDFNYCGKEGTQIYYFGCLNCGKIRIQCYHIARGVECNHMGCGYMNFIPSCLSNKHHCHDCSKLWYAIGLKIHRKSLENNYNEEVLFKLGTVKVKSKDTAILKNLPVKDRKNNNWMVLG